MTGTAASQPHHSNQLEDTCPGTTEAIERDIENARNQLAQTLDVLAVRTNPKRLVETTKHTVLAKLNEPAVKAALIGPVPSSDCSCCARSFR